MSLEELIPPLYAITRIFLMNEVLDLL